MRLFFPASAEVLTDREGHGEGLIAWQILSALAERGHEVVACAPRTEISGEAAFTVIGVPPRVKLESIQVLDRSLQARQALKRLGGSGAFDVAHWLFPQGRDFMLSLLPSSVPLVVGPIFPPWPAARNMRMLPGDLIRLGLRPLTGAIYTRTLKNAAATLVAIPEVSATLPAAARPARVVPFGIDTSGYQAAELPRQPKLLFLGRLVRDKGIFQLLDAFEVVQARGLDVELVVAGTGPEADAVRSRVAALPSPDRVQRLGQVPHDQVPALLRDVSLVCIPAVGEPFGMAILEAMAAGRAVLAIDRAGPAYLLSHARDQLLPANDPERLADAVVRLVSAPERLAELGQRNRRRVDDEFTMDSVIDGLEAVYDEVRARSSASKRAAIRSAVKRSS